MLKILLCYRLKPEDLSGEQLIPLRYVKFQNVQNLQVIVYICKVHFVMNFTVVVAVYIVSNN